MNTDQHLDFQRRIDESFAGVLSADDEQSLRKHLDSCAACREYLSASNRVIAGLGGFSFEVNPALNASVMSALRQRAEQDRGVGGRASSALQGRNAPNRNWAAFVAALSLSCVGSALVYQAVSRLAAPMHLVPAQVEAGVLVFWLLPSLGAAFCALTAKGEKRGIA